MKLYLELTTQGSNESQEVEEACRQAQDVANKLGVTVQLRNGNYGAVYFESQAEGVD